MVLGNKPNETPRELYLELDNFSSVLKIGKHMAPTVLPTYLRETSITNLHGLAWLSPVVFHQKVLMMIDDFAKLVVIRGPLENQ